MRTAGLIPCFNEEIAIEHVVRDFRRSTREWIARHGRGAATACLPRAHELRYWLYIPLFVLPVNLRYLYRSPYRALIPGALVALMAYGVAEAVLSTESDLLTARRLSMAALRADMPQQVMQSLRATGRYCAPADDWLFRYSEALAGVPGVLSRVAQDCAATQK
jgi:hypothetical protein